MVISLAMVILAIVLVHSRFILLIEIFLRTLRFDILVNDLNVPGYQSGPKVSAFLVLLVWSIARAKLLEAVRDLLATSALRDGALLFFGCSISFVQTLDRRFEGLFF